MEKLPLVSVVIVNFNGKKYIGECLLSLQKQTYQNFEIIVVDNNSKDGSFEFISRNFPKVKIIKNMKNVGFAEGNNIGMKYASGKYIALLNPDTETDKKWLEELVKVMESNSKIGMCASKVLYSHNPNIINSVGNLILKDLTTINKGMGEKDEKQYEKIEEVFGFYGAACIIRKNALKKVGGFDKNYFLHREEDEVAWKMRLNGWKSYYVPKAIVYHKRSVTTGIASLTKLYYGERNRLWNVFKFLPFHLIIYSFFFSFYRYLYMTFKLKRKSIPIRVGKLKILLTLTKSWLDAFIFLPTVLKYRKKIKIINKISKNEIYELLRKYSGKISDVERLYKLF